MVLHSEPPRILLDTLRWDDEVAEAWLLRISIIVAGVLVLLNCAVIVVAVAFFGLFDDTLDLLGLIHGRVRLLNGVLREIFKVAGVGGWRFG